MTPEQDREYVDRIAKFVIDELDMDKAWFIAASGDIYRRMEAIEHENRNAPNTAPNDFSCCPWHRAGGDGLCGFVASIGPDGKPVRE